MRNIAILVSLLFFALLISCSDKQSGLSYKYVEGAEQVIVYSEEGRFAAWPANNGAFIFEGGEMLAIFYYSTKEQLHQIHATIWNP